MILRVNDVCFSYGSKPVLKHVSASLKKGEILCLMGPNGSGKSTLIDCIMGLNRLDKRLRTQAVNEILMDGQNIEKMSRQDIARMAAFVPQTHSVSFPYTVREAVMMGRTAYVSPFGIPPESDKALADEALKRVGIYELADSSYGSISGGELRLVLLARALCQGTPLILMDEPTAHLDFRNEMKFLEIVSELVLSDGIALLLATHAPEHAFYFENKGIPVTALFLKDGSVVASGKPCEVITEDLLSSVYGIKAKILESEGEKVILRQRTI